jgi:hypothetical protein
VIAGLGSRHGGRWRAAALTVVALLVAAGGLDAQQPAAPDPQSGSAGPVADTLRPATVERGDAPADLTRQVAASDTAALGARRGTEAARYEATSQWVFRGFLGGLTLGPIGAGVAWTAANNSAVALTPQHRTLLLQEGGAEYAAAYQDAFAETLLARRKRSALTGGAFGTAALAATITAIWAIYYYY